MSDASTTFFTDEIAAHDAYKLCAGLIVPRPIGWIGSLSAEGIANLAPYLASDEPARTTGVVVPIDGGMTAA